MKFARVISLILAVLLVFGVFASCVGSGPATSSKPDTSSKQDNTEDVSSEEFDDNTSSEEEEKIPGNDTAADDEDSSDNKDDSEDNEEDNYDEPPEDEEVVDEASYFDDKSLLTYYYETDVYAYAITVYGDEVFAFKEKDGSYFDVLSGAGKFRVGSESGDLLTTTTVRSYERSFINNTLAITVTYDYIAVNEVNEASNLVQATYSFFEEYVDVAYRVVFNSTSTISKENSFIQRSTYAEYESVVKKMSHKWVYPEDNDYPYKKISAWSQKHIFDDKHTLYTFNYGNPPDMLSGTMYLYKSYPDLNIPAYFQAEDTKSIDFTAQYALVFFNGGDEDLNAYKANFYFDKAPYAAGITAITENDDNTTLFVKDKVDFNLNITNLFEDDLTVDVRYDIRDYYGKIVDSGIYLGSTVFGGLDANRKITIDAKKHGYGMFFINFKVYTKKYIFYDYVPVILIENIDYPNRSSFPFGIAQVIDDRRASLTDQTSLLKKIGSGYIRWLTSSVDSEAEIQLNKNCINELRQLGMFIPGMRTEWHDFNDPAAQVYYDTYASMFEYFCADNELNMEVHKDTNITEAETSGLVPMTDYTKKVIDDVWNRYYKNVILDQKALCEKYNWTFIYAGISAGPDYWYDKIVASGDWNTDSVLAVHGYSLGNKCPDAPEDIKSNRRWSHEAMLMRTRNYVNKMAETTGKAKKRWFVNEVGYSSVFFGDTEGSERYCVDIRTKADYDMRCLITSDAYGAEYTELYCMLDYGNSGYGISQFDTEYGYGAFYMPDYYGRILPKPTANAFITVAQVLDGIKSSTESSKYSNGPLQNWNSTIGTKAMRVFDFNTIGNGHVFVAWSNCDRQSNDTTQYGGIRPSRDPALPWNTTNFVGTENLVIESDKDYITVVRLGGKEEKVKVVNGKATVAVGGSMVFILGAK